MPKVDPNLRKVLDTLSEAGVEHPTQDMEVLRSILDRLDPARKVRAERGAPPLGGTVPAAEAERLRAERDALAARQAELEARVARLETEDEAGHLTLVDADVQDDIVSFERVDLSGFEEGFDDEEEELLEFQPLEPATPDWGAGGGAWEETDQPWEDPAAWGETPSVDWDDESNALGGATETYHDDGDETPVWEAPNEAEVTSETAWQATPESGDWSDDALDLDERTKADLRELESQLASLEAEMERHRSQKKT